MTPKDRLLRLFDFDKWSNNKVLEVLEKRTGYANENENVSLFCHLLGAEELWYRRITGMDLSDFEVWPDCELAECGTMIARLHSNWHELILNTENLHRVISYRNSSGTPYDTALSDIFHHVIIHGQHHRAQIASSLRDAGIDPPATDFIFYTRDTESQ